MGAVLYAFKFITNMKIVIINISHIVSDMIPRISSMLKADYPHYKIEDCIDACIFKSFNNVFCLSISDRIGTNLFIYDEVYSQVRYWLDSAVRQSVNPNEFNIFKGCDLKAITNGEALFIIENSNYARY